MHLAEDMIYDPSLEEPTQFDMITAANSSRRSLSPSVSKPTFNAQGTTINFDAGSWLGTFAVRPLGQHLLELNIFPAGGNARPVPPEVIFTLNPLDRPGSVINANPWDKSDPAGRPLTVTQVGKMITVDLWLKPLWEAHKEDVHDITDGLRYEVGGWFK